MESYDEVKLELPPGMQIGSLPTDKKIEREEYPVSIIRRKTGKCFTAEAHAEDAAILHPAGEISGFTAVL